MNADGVNMIQFKCPFCGGVLELKRKKCNACGKSIKTFGKNIYSFLPEFREKDIRLSQEKWEKLYKKTDRKKILQDFNAYRDLYFQDTYDQVKEAFRLKNCVYLEIGCGEFVFGNLIAKDCKLVIGVDFSVSALLSARKLMEENGVKNYLLIHADINRLPFADNQIDLIYGGGVIEHFDSTERVVRELYRVLRKGGVSFNTVPYLNLGALTYRQIWGNIPDLPVLKQIYEFIHMKIFRGKTMRFGYEKSFTAGKLRRIHRKAGFREVRTDNFRVKLILEFLPGALKGIATWLCEHSRLFWPMIKVIGKK